jgi:signal transduction histidine kinase
MLLSVILLVQTAAHAADSEQKRVMILHSFGQDFRPWGDYARTIRAELARQSPWPLDIHDHSLITARSNNENPDSPFVEYLSALEAGRRLDLIICLGAPAAGFVQRHRSRLFPSTPMVLTSVEQRRIRFDGLTPNDVAVPVAHDFPAIFDNILRILPKTRRIMVINGASPNEKFWLGELQRDAKRFEGRVEFVWNENTPFETIANEAAALPPDSAIFWHLMSVDAAGNAYEGDTALRKLYAVAKAPIFAYDDSYFGTEVVGGPMFSVIEGSRLAASVAIRILGGEKAGDIKVPPLRYAAPKYDWRQLQRWGIATSRLPAGSQVYFRGQSIWERYHWQIALVCAVVLVQACLIAILLYEHRRRKLAEIEARQRIAELAHVNRYTLAGELTTSIAHELNQPLGSILVNTETAALMLESPAVDLNELKEILSDIRRDDQRAGEVIRRLRSLLKRAPFDTKEIDLNEVVLEALDLVAALAHARGVSLNSILAEGPLPVKADNIQLQQVLINLIVNAIDAMERLEKAQRRITVCTARAGDSVEIEIADSGPGIPAGNLDEIFEPFYTTKPNGMGMGLSIARTIIDAHDGNISADTSGQRGAVFRIVLPLARTRASDLAAS